jgi:hypothetical protein
MQRHLGGPANKEKKRKEKEKSYSTLQADLHNSRRLARTSLKEKERRTAHKNDIMTDP